MRLTNAQREGAADAVRQRARRSRRHGAGDALGVRARRAGDRPAHRDRARRRARGRSARDVPVVTLATAHPAKFRDAVERATGVRPRCPRGSATCSSARSATTTLPGDARRGRRLHRRARDAAADDRARSDARSASRWADYGLIDSGHGRKLERYGRFRFIRPEPQAMWAPRERRLEGRRRVRPRLRRGRRRALAVRRPGPARGLAAEMGRRRASPRRPRRSATSASSPTWRRCGAGCASGSTACRDAEALNLFGYTGVGTLALASKGVKMVHVDASKKSVEGARANAQLAGMADSPVRWMVDDADQVRRARGAARAALRRDPARPAQVRPRARGRGVAARGRPAAADRRLPQAARRRHRSSCS